MGTAYRLAAGANAGEKLVGMMNAINVAFASPAPRLDPADWLIGILGAAAIRLFVYVEAKNAKKFRRDEEYGSARWAALKTSPLSSIPGLRKTPFSPGRNFSPPTPGQRPEPQRLCDRLLMALAFSQMFNLLCERADNVHGGRLPHHVRVLWDEAANTGQVPNLEKLVAVIRSREVSLTLFYQAQSQCKAIYKDNAETIMGNMDSVVFLGGREHSTVKEISEAWLGKQTISMQTDSRSRGQSESYSQNTQRLGRELMTMDELTTMPGDKCILQLRGLRPFFSPKYDLKQHPNYLYTAEADRKNPFDLSRLIQCRMEKLDPSEQYTVYEADVPEEAGIGEDEDIFNYYVTTRTPLYKPLDTVSRGSSAA